MNKILSELTVLSALILITTAGLFMFAQGAIRGDALMISVGAMLWIGVGMFTVVRGPECVENIYRLAKHP